MRVEYFVDPKIQFSLFNISEVEVGVLHTIDAMLKITHETAVHPINGILDSMTMGVPFSKGWIKLSWLIRTVSSPSKCPINESCGEEEEKNSHLANMLEV